MHVINYITNNITWYCFILLTQIYSLIKTIRAVLDMHHALSFSVLQSLSFSRLKPSLLCLLITTFSGDT